MAGYVVIGALAAFGLLCMVWTVWSLWIPKSGRARLLRCRWLRGLGLVELTFEIPEREMEKLMMCGPQGAGLGAKDYGAGTGDPPGCHQCGGIPEL